MNIKLLDEFLFEFWSWWLKDIATIDDLFHGFSDLLKVFPQIIFGIKIFAFLVTFLHFLFHNLNHWRLLWVKFVQHLVNISSDFYSWGMIVLFSDLNSMIHPFDKVQTIGNIHFLLVFLNGDTFFAKDDRYFWRIFLDSLYFRTPTYLCRFGLLYLGILAMIQCVGLNGFDDIFIQKILIFVTVERSFARNNEIKWFLFLNKYDFIAYVVVFTSIWQFREPHPQEKSRLSTFWVHLLTFYNHWAHFSHGRRRRWCFRLLLGSRKRPGRHNFIVRNLSEKTMRWGNWFLVGQDVEASHPKISIIFIVGFELINSFFCDKVEFWIFDNLYGVDLRELYTFTKFLKGLICIVIKVVVKDHEVPPLPDRNEAWRFFLQVSAGLLGLVDNLLIE